MSKNIIITFDYELFFGDEPGTVEKSLINPTNLLLDALDSIEAKSTFFVDYLMLKYMLAENELTKKDANLIIKQLKEIIRRGHRIELHIHPHWIDAKFCNNKWDFSNFSHYCLNSFKKDEITSFFIEGTQMLESIAREVDSSYKVIAYRAGGWAILPFASMKEGFTAAGIKIDSSIIKGSIVHANGYTLDFTCAPEESMYRFSDDITQKNDSGEFLELQIGSFNHNILSTLLNIIYHKNNPSLFKPLTDGTHFRAKDKKTDSTRLSRWAFLHQRQIFSLAGLPSFLLNYEIRKQKQKYVVLISHPKDLMPITCDNIRKLNQFQFYTFKDVVG